MNILKSRVPDSDIIIATSWETAYFVNNLPKEKGEKFYFVQHYEIWDLWSNLSCWEKAIKIEKDGIRLPLAMTYVSPEKPYIKKFKAMVDYSYVLPLKKITISLWLKNLLEQRFKQKVYDVIPNGINFDIFYCSKNEKNWNSEKKIILMPYRGIRWKGDEDGIYALNNIHKRYGHKVEIWLYGPKSSHLPQWIKFFERPNDEKLRELYCKAHIFVAPSWVEGFYLPPLEAMACKCSVVTTNVGAVPDYVIPEQTAIVVPPRSPQKIEEGLSYLLDNWSIAKRIAENGYKYVRQLTWEKSVDKLERLFKKVITEKIK